MSYRGTRVLTHCHIPKMAQQCIVEAGGGLAEQAKAWKELGEEAPVEGRAAYDGQTQVTLW